ncbi:rhomboid family intramembrane serine protease [Pararhodobacter zhoushanensis]|uniref:rhomboid family intramembrane serine protease n=1 Tax=Pararhodobacter zhoushanensis TaxID=2479545 RepID=UPI000F8E92AF|nr:rhomboid family intramembrane serine protease [Pararhodobacter zhoushanensis]
MLPIRDRNPSGQVPYVTWGLIAVNIVVFMAYYPLGTDESVLELYRRWAMIPARLSAGEGLATPLVAMFVHGGWFHLGLNMLFLRIFGDNLEAEFGPVRFLAFYLLCGLIAFALQYVAAPLSLVPVAGASGAVAGVMGGYLLMFPRARVDVATYYVIGLRTFAAPAWLLLGLWFALQVWGGLATPADGGVAFWAHIGGFLAGVGLSARTWRLRGGRMFWSRFHGLPPHPQAPIAVPVVRRRGAILPPPQAHGLFRREGDPR